MKQILFDHLICPLDGLPLVKTGNSTSCSSGHNYDYDRKGTLNLLPVQFRKSKNPGDSKEMIVARERFLNSGFYQPISDQLNTLIKTHSKEFFILDAGCGEGYYTKRLADFLEASNSPQYSVVGLDISKDAIHSAAKRSRDIAWIVATNANIPILPDTIDCVTSLFGFAVWPEFHRVLKTGGLVITADVGPDHLIELRRVLYPEIKSKESEAIIPDGFELIDQYRLQHTAKMPEDARIEDLLVMTPHGYRATKDKLAEAVQTNFDQITLDVLFKIYRAKDLL